MEYKPERANQPTRFTLVCLILAFKDLQVCNPDEAKSHLRLALKYASDREAFDIETIIDYADNPDCSAMDKIESVLTCGGRIYDEFSDFLKPKENVKGE